MLFEWSKNIKGFQRYGQLSVRFMAYSLTLQMASEIVQNDIKGLEFGVMMLSLLL